MAKVRGHRGKQAIRQHRLLQAIRIAGRPLTVEELLAVLDHECARRTLYRDLEQLQSLGYPLTSAGGAWSIERRNSPAVPVPQSALLGLCLNRRALANLTGQRLMDDVQALQDAFAASLDEEGRAVLEEHVVTLSTGDPGSLSLVRSHLVEELRGAIADQERTEVVYADPELGTRLERVVDPYALWQRAGVPHLIAYCTDRDRVEVLSVERILGALPLGQRFERRPDFSLQEFVQSQLGSPEGEPLQVRLSFAPRVAHLPREQVFHHGQEVREMDDGSVELSCPLAGLPEVAAWVVSFGGDVVALEPPELVEEVVRRSEAALRRHTARRVRRHSGIDIASVGHVG